jgi:hypothetical protein
MSQPQVGEVLYTSDKKTLRRRVRVVRVEGTTVWTVPSYVRIEVAQQGNLFDADGNRCYMV